MASGGKLPTYNVLQGGFWSAGLAGGGTRANNDKSGTSFVEERAPDVGVVAEVGCEPDPAEDAPLRLGVGGMANGGNEPFDCVGPCDRIAATV